MFKSLEVIFLKKELLLLNTVIH